MGFSSQSFRATGQHSWLPSDRHHMSSLAIGEACPSTKSLPYSPVIGKPAGIREARFVMKYSLACCLALTTALIPAYSSAQVADRVSLSSDITAIEGQILAAEGEKTKFSGGAIVALIDARIQTLLLNKSVLELQIGRASCRERV